MQVQRRAYVIGLLGPALQAIGLTWEALHVLIAHWSQPLSARHLAYEPGVLLLIVGLFVSLVCIPVAIEVAQAKERELEIPVYEPEAQPGRASAHGYSSGRR
ncbi:MAG TPA: hypothetical protein VI876_06135 [Dehalococcoidia bacterium]|jgi:hypothetical protein|nr:hypothetical protein [Dehalococcoidia bacterium]